MNFSDFVTIPAQVMARQVGAETVILDLTSGTYFGLNAMGARMWQIMASGERLSSICDVLTDEFDVTRETLERDLKGLVRDLADKGLISLSS